MKPYNHRNIVYVSVREREINNFFPWKKVNTTLTCFIEINQFDSKNTNVYDKTMRSLIYVVITFDDSVNFC